PSSTVGGRTWGALLHDHPSRRPLTRFVAPATAARGTGALHGTSRRGRSAPPPWLAYRAPPAWPNPCPARGPAWSTAGHRKSPPPLPLPPFTRRRAPLGGSPQRSPLSPATYPLGGWAPGGTRTRSPSRTARAGRVTPAAMAGVQSRHCLAEPLPWVGSGWGNGR